MHSDLRTRLLVVAGNAALRAKLVEWLEIRNVKFAIAQTAKDAIEMLSDARFIDFAFDGLIADELLPDASGWRVIREFRRTYPVAPIATLVSENDATLAIWARANAVHRFEAWELEEALAPWLEMLRATA